MIFEKNKIKVSQEAYDKLLARIVELEEEIFGCNESANIKSEQDNNDNLGATIDYFKTEKGKLQMELRTALEKLGASDIVKPNDLITGVDLYDTVSLVDNFGDDLTIYVSGDYDSNVSGDYYSLPLQSPIVEKIFTKEIGTKFIMEVKHDQIVTKIAYTITNIDKNKEVIKTKSK